MSHYRLYTGDDGETHIEAHEPALATYALSRVDPPHEQAESEPMARLVFFHFLPGTAGEWHTAPRRQYLFLQAGELEVTPSGGEAHTLRPGDSVLIEDTTGKGHLTRASPSEGARGAFVHLAGEAG